MRTIAAGLHPAIFATFAIGIPALSIRETAVCHRSWKRQASAVASPASLPLEFSLRILPARSLAASHASVMLPMGFDGSTWYALGLNSSPPGPYRSAGNTRSEEHTSELQS